MIPGEDQLPENRADRYIEHLEAKVERLTTEGRLLAECRDREIAANVELALQNGGLRSALIEATDWLEEWLQEVEGSTCAQPTESDWARVEKFRKLIAASLSPASGKRDG